MDASEIRKVVERVRDGDPELVNELACGGPSNACESLRPVSAGWSLTRWLS